jgi:hypothetical protein
MEQSKTQTKPKTLKEKLLMLREQVRKPLLILFAIIPLLGIVLYSLPFPMISLYDLFVEYLFGSFWIAVLFISLIFFVILMLGGISYYTVIIFMLYYFLAMSIGYGNALLTVPIAVFGLIYAIYQVFRLLENR